MKIPKYILNKMEQRRNLGNRLMCLDAEITRWIENETGKPSYEVLEDPFMCGSILLCTEPEILMQRQIELIEGYNNEDDKN